MFLLAVILVPDRLYFVNNTWDYFLSIRGWFFGGVIVLNSIDALDTFYKGVAWGTRVPYLVYWVALTLACIVGHDPSARRGV